MTNEDEFIFSMQHEAHSESLCKWIMDSGATKHMTLQRAFDIYKVIFVCNVCLGDDSVAEDIVMGSISMGGETQGKATRVCITDVFHVPKLHANLLLMS